MNAELAFTLLSYSGMTNVLALILIFFSCRCLAGKRIFTYLNRFGWYKTFYRIHCVFWWIFLISILVHMGSAWYLFGLPLSR
jgi:hypothetical protein